MKDEAFLFHYTTVQKFKEILLSGRIKACTSHGKFKDSFNGRKSFKKYDFSVWFSKEQDWEPTATKLARDGLEDIVTLTPEEQFILPGLARIGVKYSSDLTSWKNYKHLSKVKPGILKGMEEAGINLGANPDNWYCLFRDFLLGEFKMINCWDGMNWSAFDIQVLRDMFTC